MNPSVVARRHFRRICAGALITAFMLMLTGCFGTKPPKPQFESISGTVSAPPSAAFPEQVVPAAVDHTLVAGASVMAFDFATAKQVGTTVATDGNGRYTISSVPKGIDVVVIAVADVAALSSGSRIRLSTLIVDVAKGTGGDIDGATTLAAEAWGKHYGQGIDMHAWDFQMSLDAAMDVLDWLGRLDLTPGGTMLSAEYGNGLAPLDELAPVTNTVPAVIDPLVGPAKEMIQDLRDAGLTIKGTYEQELAEPVEAVMTDVGPYLESVAYHVDGLHPYIIMDPDGFPCGVYEEDEYGWPWFRAYYEGPGIRWIIHRNDGVSTETWTVEGGMFQPSSRPRRWTVRDLMTTTITFEVKNSEDAQFVFDGGLVLTSDDATPELVTGAVLSARLKDSRNQWLAQETTLVGDYEGEFDETVGSVRVGVNGSFSSQYINADGELVIDGNLSQGGEVRFSGSISGAGVTVAGALSLQVVSNATMPDIGLAPNDLRINGSLTKAGVATPIFEGTTYIEVENADTFDFSHDPPICPENWPTCTVEFSGSVNPRGKASVSAHITVSTEEYNAFDATVRYDHGSRWLEGTASYREPEETTYEGECHMQNQAGLRVDMEMLYNSDDSLEAMGTIKNASGVKIGDIVTDQDGLVRVEYVDGTWESLL